MKRILVTGATGFLGAHVVAVLLARGCEVVALARGSARPSSPPLGGVTERRADVLDRAALAEATAGCDGAIHCAGKVSRGASASPEMRRAHVLGTRAVLDACASAGVARVVVASTSGVVAVSEDAAHVGVEDDPTPYRLVNRWPYYRAKLWAEEEALARSRAGFEVIAVNPSLLLGPGDGRGSSTEDVRLFLEGKIAAVPSGGVSYVDARDAAEAMALALERGRGGRRYLVGASNVTCRELFARLERVSGVRGPWAPLPRLAGALAVRFASAVGGDPAADAESLDLARHYWYLDASRAERELGWSPRDPVATLADTVADLRARGVAPAREQARASP